ncbi:MAG: fluoride efflux transporter CrcB [Erythrobacter sp.]|jgi:CrcB protein|nr:fluoride efflux transporter CrcB [Erythrobacter sp.]
MPFAATLAVGLGGAIGAAARFQVGLALVRLAPMTTGFPWATLVVNIIGSLAMGALAGWFARSGAASETLRLFLTVGLLGGFTTFSAFSAELVTLLHRGQAGLAIGYAAVSVIAGMAAFVLGLVAIQAAR